MYSIKVVDTDLVRRVFCRSVQASQTGTQVNHFVFIKKKSLTTCDWLWENPPNRRLDQN